MFAYHTPTRMKGSMVVQGLKSWASALHPQLPLSRKESQRLLNALTSSFRRQLDEAHPPQGSGDARPPLAGKTGDAANKPQNHGLHSSSAAYADKHMASVLTSPLFAQGKAAKEPDVATAMVELQRNPAKGPMELLEEYHEKGHATLPIAVACLELFNKSLEGLPAARRKDVITETAAGKRALLWVWQSKTYESEQFVQDVRLAELMVTLVVQEGYEKYLWEWLAMDMPAGQASALPENTPHMKAQRHPYRWKGIIIRDIVAAKIQDAKSFDPGLEALFRALELKDSRYIPLAATMVYLRRVLRRPAKSDGERRMRTNPALYDRFVEVCLDARFASNNKTISEYEACDLSLGHPTRRSPLPALSLLKRGFHPDQPLGQGQNVRTIFTNPNESAAARAARFYFFVRTLRQLEDMGRTDDAAWVGETCKEVYPEFAERLDKAVHQARLREREEDRMVRAPAAQTPVPGKIERIPMPSFAI